MKKPTTVPYWRKAFEKLAELVRGKGAVSDDELAQIKLSARGHAGGINSPKKSGEPATETVAKAMSLMDRQYAVETAIQQRFGAPEGLAVPAAPNEHFYIEDAFEDFVIVCRYPDRTLFRVDYAISAAGEVTLGELVQVEEVFAPVEEPAEPVEAGADRTLLFKADEERHLLYGVVAEPETPDTYGDWLSAEEIERACHAFMREYQAVGLEHMVKAEACRVVESYIVPADLEIGNQMVRKGSWFLVTHVDTANPDGEAIWQAVKAGEFTGYSYQGYGRRTARGLPVG